ncbi:aconitase X swivel domain-containing protein [Microbacterium sp. 22179]|uniref:aconitase X swivel domain-containing protein n=1 Tax=Microbacterium sp. 22179 TaxID=3453886 RepID=UPI003F85573B
MTAVLLEGRGTGPLLRLQAPLSFWGGVGHDGTVVDVHHPDRGRSLSGVVLAMDAGRGSSSSSSVLAELIRAGVGPCAILLASRDAIVVTGALVAAELYDVRVPVVLVPPAAQAGLAGRLTVDTSQDPIVRTSGDASSLRS